MSVRVEWTGLSELLDELRNLPRELVDEARPIVHERAHQAERAIYAQYPAVTGNLRRGLRVEDFDNGPFGAGAVVRNTAKHAYLYDYGTQARHTALGAFRGSMPPTHVFVRNCITYRHRMYDDLRALLERHGMVVSGTP